MMKITAFGDQFDNEKRDFGRHHALDIYRIVAMLDEEQYAQTKLQFAEHASDPSAQRAVYLDKELFGTQYEFFAVTYMGADSCSTASGDETET